MCFISEELNKLSLCVRKESEAIAKPLSSEDMQIQSMADASPIKWHLAHTSWAFETFILKNRSQNYQKFDPNFEYLFNSYYNAIGEQYVMINGHFIKFQKNETIHTENSHKYSDESFLQLVSQAGMKSIKNWSDKRGFLSIYYLRPN